MSVLLVVYRDGAALVEQGRVSFASTERARRAVARALRGDQLEQVSAIDENGVIIEGIVTHERGSDGHARLALARLPNALVTAG